MTSVCITGINMHATCEIMYFPAVFIILYLFHINFVFLLPREIKKNSPKLFIGPILRICGQCCKVLAKKGLVTPIMIGGLQEKNNVVVKSISGFVRTIQLKIYKLLQVCKQVVTNLFTSCRKVVFALLVPSYCNRFGTSC
jgi:hypothetical protein